MEALQMEVQRNEFRDSVQIALKLEETQVT